MSGVRSEACPAALFHGPGHQSQSRCEKTGPHTVHETHYPGGHAEWRDGQYTDLLRAKNIAFDPEAYPDNMAMTGFFDEPPDLLDLTEGPATYDGPMAEDERVVPEAEVERLREALNKPLRETILAVLRTMPADAAPEHLAAIIERQVREWQAREAQEADQPFPP